MNNEVNPDQYEWIRKLAHIRRTQRTLTLQEKEAKAAIESFLGGRKRLEYEGQLVMKVVMITQRPIDVKALREERPDIAKEFETETTYPRFDVADGVL